MGDELNEFRRAADRLDEAVASLYGLNRTDLRCLGILYRRGRVTAGELAEEAGLTPGAITTALDRMEKGGYANRASDPEDRRRVLVLSTVAAREVGARVYGEVEVASHRLLESLEVSGGASEVEVWLPAVEGTVPVRLSGGASQVTLHRPANVAMRADISGGASQLIFDGRRENPDGSRNHFESAGFRQAADRYEVRFSGGASQITIDTA